MTVGTSFRFAAAFATFATLALYLLQKRPLKKAARNKHPPGPKPLPLVGNVKDLPTSFEWETFAEWAKQYGKPDSVERGLKRQAHTCYKHRGYNALEGVWILYSCSEFRSRGEGLAGRSKLYHSRSVSSSPEDPISGQRSNTAFRMGWGLAVQFMQFGPRFKKYRKAVQNQLSPQKAAALRPVLEKCTKVLVESIKTQPEAFLDHIKKSVLE